MKKDEIVELDIVSYGKDGEGVAKLNDFVVFVPGCLVGEKIKAQIVLVKKNFAVGRVIKIVVPSKDRVTPLCPIFFKCGGCDMQHVSYEYQLKVKRENVKNCIDKATGLDVSVDEVVHGDKLFGYRNKVQVPIRKIKNIAYAGFYKEGTHTFVPFVKSENSDLGDCPLHTRQMQNIIDAVVNYINEYNISTYDEVSNKGLIRHLVLRRVNESYSICLVINGEGIFKQNKLIDALKKLNISFALYISKNLKQTNVIMGDSIECIYGDENIKGEALGVEYTVNPNSFLQINDEIRDAIYSKVNQIISTTKDAIVYDVFSGIGIMSNMFAKYAKEVISIEIVKEAIEDAKKIAVMNNNKNIKNICGDAAVELPKVIKGNSIIVIDPPRKGCSDRVINSIIESKANKIIYISCNPATLARDLKLLIENYNIISVTPYDMFPQTKHVETMVLLSKVQN